MYRAQRAQEVRPALSAGQPVYRPTVWRDTMNPLGIRLPRIARALCAIVLCAGVAGACGKALFAEDGFPVERRKDQFPSEPLYLVLPIPYSLPGIGSGWALTLYEANYGFYHRAYAIAVTGEAQGTILGLEQAALVPRHLLLDLYGEQIGKAVVNAYTLRGMNTGKNDYFLEQAQYDFYAPRLTLSFWERRFEAYVESGQSEARVSKVLDRTGVLISQFAHPLKYFQTNTVGNVQLDLSDDLVDPRRGVRLYTRQIDFPPQNATQPDFYVVTTSLFAYLPVGRQSTIAITGFQSDAYVRKAGLIDINALMQQYAQICAQPVGACKAGEAALINNQLAANTHGTSQSLGGQNYLRAYPGNRFQGAHTLYAAVEFRWNLTDEFTPFNYWFFKGVRTGIQIAPFYETGSVSETSGSLGQRWRSDVGVGLRIITASGAVYRADVATGDEGEATTVIFSYPW